MKIRFCIGNGASRLGESIDGMQNIGPVYGSNIVYRTMQVDNLIAVDDGVLRQVVNSDYKCNMYTLPEHVSKFTDVPYVRPLPNIPYKGKRKFDAANMWSSEAYALLLTAIQGSDIVFMVGYDIWDNPKTMNSNVYQMAKIFEHYPETQFVQIQNSHWEIPPSWEPYKNFLMDNYKTMRDFIDANTEE